MLALDLQTHIPTHTPTYMFPSQAEKLQAKASPVASSRPVCVPVLLNERSLAAERSSLSWQRRSISFLSYPCHHILTISLFSPSACLPPLLPSSLRHDPPPPPFTLSVARSFVFISLIYSLCQMQADSHQSLTHTHTDAHTPDPP